MPSNNPVALGSSPVPFASSSASASFYAEDEWGQVKMKAADGTHAKTALLPRSGLVDGCDSGDQSCLHLLLSGSGAFFIPSTSNKFPCFFFEPPGLQHFISLSWRFGFGAFFSVSLWLLRVGGRSMHTVLFLLLASAFAPAGDVLPRNLMHRREAGSSCGVRWGAAARGGCSMAASTAQQRRRGSLCSRKGLLFGRRHTSFFSILDVVLVFFGNRRQRFFTIFGVGSFCNLLVSCFGMIGRLQVCLLLPFVGGFRFAFPFRSLVAAGCARSLAAACLPVDGEKVKRTRASPCGLRGRVLQPAAQNRARVL